MLRSDLQDFTSSGLTILDDNRLSILLCVGSELERLYPMRTGIRKAKENVFGKTLCLTFPSLKRGAFRHERGKKESAYVVTCVDRTTRCIRGFSIVWERDADALQQGVDEAPPAITSAMGSTAILA